MGLVFGTGFINEKGKNTNRKSSIADQQLKRGAPFKGFPNTRLV